MSSPAAPTQASSKTVTSIEIPFLRMVLDLEPTFERDKHNELFYPFGEAGHRARNFYGDPYVSGAYTGVPYDITPPAISEGVGIPFNLSPPGIIVQGGGSYNYAVLVALGLAQ
jgi:hypothetical protein